MDDGVDTESWSVIAPGAHTALFGRAGDPQPSLAVPALPLAALVDLLRTGSYSNPFDSTADAAATAPRTPDATAADILTAAAAVPCRLSSVAVAAVVLPFVRQQCCIVLLHPTAPRGDVTRLVDALFHAGAAQAHVMSEAVAASYAVGIIGEAAPEARDRSAQRGLRVLDVGYGGARLSYVRRGQALRFLGGAFPASALAAEMASGGGLGADGATFEQREVLPLARKLLDRISSSSHGTPLLITGGRATPALAAAVRAAIRAVEASSDDDGPTSDDGEVSGPCRLSVRAVRRPKRHRADDGATLRHPCSVITLPGNGPARAAFIGASLLGAVTPIALGMSSAEHAEHGPELVFSRCPL